MRAPLPATSMLRHHPYLDVCPALAMAWFDFRHRLAYKQCSKPLPRMGSAQVSLYVCSLSGSNAFQMKLLTDYLISGFFNLKRLYLRVSDSRGLLDDLPWFQCRQHTGTASMKGKSLQDKDHHIQHCKEWRFLYRETKINFYVTKRCRNSYVEDQYLL